MENIAKIEKIKIQNFKGLKSYEGEVKGKDVYLIGKNAAGKSSFIEAVFFALTGKNLPPKPVTTGAKKGLIELTLDDGFVIRVKMNSTGKTPVNFEIENLNAPDGQDPFVKAPRTWLQKRIGIIDFDVNEFFKMSDAKQIEYFCKITGLEVSEMDTQIEELSESRKFDKKKLAEAMTKTGFYNAEDAKKEPINVVELSTKINALVTSENTKAETYNNVIKGISERKESKKELERQLTEIQAKLNGGEYFNFSGFSVVVEKGLNQQIAGGKEWLLIPENIPSDNPELIKMQEDFQNSEAINKKITEAKEFEAADKEIEKLQNAIEESTNEIQEQKDLKAKAIAEKIDIEGLSYDIEKECFLFNGLPFDKTQINTASQIIAGLKIGASLLNEIKILKVDASLIDKENFKEVQKWSQSQGIELFIELVDREAGELKIEIEENEQA
jgi:hypothetical protein